MTNRLVDGVARGPVSSRYPAVLACGFRPMFTLAAGYAALSVPLYLLVWFGFDLPLGRGGPALWHGHEMLFGYASGVFGGFLLTAVPNWTGMPPVRDGRLLILVLLWLAGRVAFWLSGLLAPLAVAIVDAAFLLALALCVSPAILGARNRRNYVFFVLIGALIAANAMMHVGLLGWNNDGSVDIARRGQFLALDILLLMIAVIGGRIIPNFTSNFLRLQPGLPGEQSVVIGGHRAWDRLALASLPAVVIIDLAFGDSATPTALICVVAGLANMARLTFWRGWKVRHQPILFVLHVGYAWFAVGLLLRGLSIEFPVFDGAAGLHALTIGAIGTMTMAVMARAALGHTGRPLRASMALVVALALVSLAAAFRLTGAVSFIGSAGPFLLIGSGVAWSLAFAIFTATLIPMVLRPRIDGLPG